VRACWSLAVAVLVPVAALASPPPGSAASVVIDLEPAPGVPAWFASSFERTITRELAGFERLTTVVKQDVAAGACGADRDCRVRAYRDAGIDIVLFGDVGDDAIAYELYQTWTPARLDTGEIDIGRDHSLVALEHATRRAFHVVLKHGGLLDQRPYADVPSSAPFAGAAGGARVASAPAPTAHTSWNGKHIGLVLALFALLALPFGLALLGGESPATIARMRTARRAGCVIAALALAAAALDPRRIGDALAAAPWLFAGIGGLGWGAFLVSMVRAVLPPLDGLERVRHGELTRILATFCLAAIERLVTLAALYAPIVWLAAWLGTELAIPERWGYILLAPAVVWLARLWFAMWVECIAARLDRKLVEGSPTHDNPWSREIGNYLMGYVRRTGWDVEPELLATVMFLPGKRVDGVACYGGGATRARIVIERELLVTAMGPLLELEPDQEPALWPDWTSALVGPRSQRRQPATPPSLHDFRGHKQRTIYPGMQRRPLGQAATLLGYTTPSPGQLVPLISDNPQDLAIVRELLSEHYPWFAPDPDEEFDATDPTDKDLLFGALVHALGVVRRNDSQLSTLGLALGQRARRWATRLSSPWRARLADSYAALNFARNHLIQYLHYMCTGQSDLLTARARPAELDDASQRALRSLGRDAPRDIRVRLTWLSQFFPEPIVDRRGDIASRVAAGAGIAALLAAIGFAVMRSIDYHPIYVDRMHDQERSLQKGSSDVEVRER
jgi:hypothetical protein